ncbi:MAG: ATP-binding protein [Parachlamydiaceae bacterium]
MDGNNNNNDHDNRPNPEDLLQVVNREETKRRKGKLTIFLGMAAGVGKTYAMLEAAQKLKTEGVKVAVGIVDSHGRKETQELLEGLEVIPEKQIDYKGTSFFELDLDTVLKEKPQLVLVDELAHSNIKGSRHPKRWQDVLEIVDNGIDVYTTLNVQHIESLKDLVEKVTGITIRETVPDLILDAATFIKLVDLTPDDLLQRLKEGKIYLTGQSTVAALNFFQEDRLTALREIVLRYTAEKVEHELHGMVSSFERPDAWKLRERLLVAIGHSPHSQKLVRITRRLAFNLDAPWIAVYVDNGSTLSEEDREMLTKNLTLARDLGAEVITTTDPDIALAIQRVARQRSVTQIIIGRPPSRPFLDFFQRNTLMDRLAAECSDVDLHVIRQTLYQKTNERKLKFFQLSSHVSSYLVVLGCVLGLTLFNWMILPFIGYKVAGFIFLLGILSLSLFFKKGPIFFASILYAFIWLFLFTHNEAGQKTSTDDNYLLLALYLLTAITTGILIDRGRTHKEMLAKREKAIRILYEIVREIAAASSLEDVLQSVKRGLNTALDGHCEIIVKQKDDGLLFDEAIPAFKDEKEKAAVNWVFHNGAEAGWSTSTLPFAQNLYIPLKGANEVVGVLAYRQKDNKELNIEEKNFLYTVGQQLANYIERLFSEEKSKEFEEHKQVEKIYQSTLSLISNLFEGPLLSIQDSVKELKKHEQPSNSNEIIQPLEQISISSNSLSHILDNISSMVNLSAGITPVNRIKNDLKKLIVSWHKRVQESMTNYSWKIHIEDNLPEVIFDRDLIELLFYNLAFHAMEFAPPESTIEVEAKQSGDYVVMSLSGEGQSIPEELMDVAFENVYRIPGGIANAQQPQGLGLAIAKTIAEIHNGLLRVSSRPEGGMMFSLYLPL